MTALAPKEKEGAGLLPASFRVSWAASRGRLPGHDDPQVDALRAASFAAADRLGLPNRRVEDWKFTSTMLLARLQPQAAPAGNPDVSSSLQDWPLEGACVLAFAGGAFQPQLSHGALPDGVRLQRLAEAPAELAELLRPLPGGAETAPANLNQALASDGALIDVADGAAPATPVVLLHLGDTTPETNDGGMHHLRHRVRCGAGSALTLVELHLPADGAAWTNLLTDIELAPGARLSHLRVGLGGAHGLRTALLRGRLASGADYTGTALTFGGALARDEIELRLQGAGAACRLDGLNLAAGNDHLDSTLRVLHEAPRCRSNQHYRAVVDGHGHAVFQGRIVVAPGAQKSDAHQLTRSLLLSDEAVADAKPELEILADDVQCSHGASIGDLDGEALFYLRARGIGLTEARALLIRAFAAEILEGIPLQGNPGEDWRAAAEAALAARLAGIVEEQR